MLANRKKDGSLYYEDKIIRPFGEGFASFGRDVTQRRSGSKGYAL